MKVLATCQPAVGHLHPMVPVGRALVEAGHEVVVATSAPFCPFVEETGLRSVAAGLDWLESDVEQAFPDLFPDPTSLSDIRHGWRFVFARAARAAIPDLVRLAHDLRPDLVLSDSLDLSGPLAAEAAGVPHAVVGVGAPKPLAMLASSVAIPWNVGRAALGLEPDPGLDRFCPHLYLDTCPPSLRPFPSAGLAEVSWSVRPMPPDERGSAPPRWLDSASEPIVYVTMGTVFNRVASVFETVLEALADEPVRVLVTVGASRDPTTVGHTDGNVRLERFVPQSLVMPVADVVICHGGFNTTVAALAHGVPVIGLPLGADHHYNAFRVAACGAGLAIDGCEATAGLVRSAIRTVREDPLYRQNAARLAREIAAMPPPDAAVPLLERVADGSRARPAPARG